MGTLDDAIREHLELKRRAGATADEVRELESEALGPARRDAAPVDAVSAAPEPDALDEPAAPRFDAEPEPDFEPVADAGAPVPPAATPPAEPVAEADVVSEEPQWLDEDPFGDAGPDPQTTGNPPRDYVEPDEEGEDLLEETPDFLQETPEHDRLWFEQKPPRDFDFDN